MKQKAIDALDGALRGAGAYQAQACVRCGLCGESCHIHRNDPVPENLPGDESVIRFKFTDIEDMSEWWLVVTDDQIDICVKDPGKEVDVYFTSTVKTMADIWMGDTTYRKASAAGELKIVGNRALTRDVTAWMELSRFADLPPARDI